MRLEQALLEAFHYYPTLFQKRMDVMNHMFLTLGNGSEWKNGEIVENSCDCRRDEERCYQERKVPKISLNNAYARRLDYSPSENLPVHYCGSYSLISKVPKNVKPDWKAAIIWFLDSIISGESKLSSYCDKEDEILEQLKGFRRKL